MLPASEYPFARHASRRIGGMAFRLSRVPRRANTGRSDQGHGKLTWAKVREIRQFAAGDGFGVDRKAQSERLAPRYGVHPVTVQDILRNLSWYDPAYDPTQPDPHVWGGMPPSMILLRLLAQERTG